MRVRPRSINRQEADGDAAAQQQFLILHGWQNHRPVGHWQRWLASELRGAGKHVIYPQLPDPDLPVLASWLAVLRAELELLNEVPVPHQRVVICHSLACLLWLHATERLRPDETVDRVLLVAPPGPSAFAPEPVTFAPRRPFDLEAVHASSRTTPHLVCSDNDPYCPEQAAAIYGKKLRLPTSLVSGAGHLNHEAGYGPWPAVLDWCLDKTPRTTHF